MNAFLSTRVQFIAKMLPQEQPFTSGPATANFTRFPKALIFRALMLSTLGTCGRSEARLQANLPTSLC
ncbi:hypothetical protein F441_05937, partial [Phytophthora nicotianae CJ01A1]